MRIPRHLSSIAAAALFLTPVFAQDQQSQFPPPSPDNYPQRQQQQQGPPPQYSDQRNGGYQRGSGYPHFPGGEQAQDAVPVPPTLTIPAGKYLTVRTNNFIASDRNQAGDFFSATLAEPLVIDGFVVAARGQTVNGRVVDVEKAGRVKGTSSLRVELTELILVDGQQIPFHSQMVYRQGRSSVGRDAGAIGTTTAVGAAIGAGAAGGFGAGMGAIGGALAGTIGVLTTRGRPTVIYPETVMTFRVDQPVMISTARSSGAFSPVAREDYPQRGPEAGRSSGPPPSGAYYGAYGAPGPFFRPYYAPYWRAGFRFGGGPRFRGYRHYRRW